MLLQAQQECRADIGRIDDPKAQAFFETVAEVVGGLFKALEHYQAGSEPAWQTSGQKETGRRTMVEHMPKDQRIQPQGTQPSVVTDMAPDISEDYPLRNCSQNKCKLYPARNIMNRHFGKC